MRVMKTVVVVVMCWAAVGSWADGARRRGAASVPGPTATANGIVASVGAGALVVHRSNGDDVTVQVTATTLIKEHGTAIHLSDIEAGDRVEARGTRVDDHTIAAVAIEVEGAENPGDHEGATANGIVASIGASTLVVHAANGTDTMVQVNASTTIKKHGQPITLAGIAVGDRVEARGTRVDAETILAEQIEVEDVPPVIHQNASVKGAVASVGASSFVVHPSAGADTTVQVDASTRIKKHGSVLALAGVHVGDRVDVQGTRVDDHTVLAREVEVH